MRILALALLLSGCHATPAVKPALPEPMAEPDIVVVPANCRRLDRDLLKTQPKAHGVIADAFWVSGKRGKQVDALNAQLAAIATELNKGCLK